MKASWISDVASTAPIGTTPLVSPFAQVMRSGITPKRSAANGAPRRPKPVMTSSKISRMPCFAVTAAQPLQVALRRDQHAGRARDRLDDDGRDGLGAVQRHQPLELVGEMRALLRLPAREGVVGQVGVRQVVDAGQQRPEETAVVDDAADRDAAEVHPVIAALPPDQAGPAALAPSAVVGEGDLQRGIDALGA